MYMSKQSRRDLINLINIGNKINESMRIVKNYGDNIYNTQEVLIARSSQKASRLLPWH